MIDWLLKLDPREAQLEALRRSHAGVATRDSVDGPTFHRPVPGHPGNRPARGWGHFLEMRVGKTPTHLNEGALLRRDYDVKWHLVLSPNAFKEDWPLEAEKFGYPVEAFAIDSSNRKAAQRFIDRNSKHGGLLAINYESLQYTDTLRLLEDICGPQTLIGADEGISIKTPTSKTTKGAIYLAKMCAWRRDLTGKPITQGAHDLWAQLRFIGEIEGWDATVWKHTFCKMGGFQGKQIVGLKNEDQLHEILGRCSFNGRKVDWLKTPGRDYSIERVALLPKQQEMYDSMQEDFLVEVAEGLVVSADQIVTKLIKLQQIRSGFIIDEEGKVHDLMPPEKNPMIAHIRNKLETQIDGKTIIVCHYQRSMDILLDALRGWGYQPAVIRGQAWHKSNDIDLVSEKARFNGDPRCRVLVGQEQALRYGHTLMGGSNDPCYTTLFYENNYSLNDRSQCEERNQGAGQQYPINIVDFIASPKDRDVIEALQRKEDMAATVLQYVRDQGILPRSE